MNITSKFKYIVVFILFISSMWLLYTFREVLPIFILALLLAYILTPLVRRMSSRRVFGKRIPRGLAIIVIYVLSITGLSVGGTYFVVNLTNEMQILVKDIPNYEKKITESWVPMISNSIKTVSDYLPKMQKAEIKDAEPNQKIPKSQIDSIPEDNNIARYLANTRFELKQIKNGYEITPKQVSYSVQNTDDKELDIEKVIDDFVANLIANLQGLLLGLLDFSQKVVFTFVTSIFQTMITLMIAAFIIIDHERILDFFRELFPYRFLDNIELFLQRQNVGLHGVVRGQLIICLVNGTLTGIGLFILDIKFALTLSILATICSLIPIFGVIISSIPIVLMAITNSFFSGLLALAWILGIHFIEGNILNPKIIGKSAEIHPVLVIFALMAGERTFGLFGALIAVPLFSILQTTFIFVRETVFVDLDDTV